MNIRCHQNEADDRTQNVLTAPLDWNMRVRQDIAELLAPRNLSGWRLNPPEWHRYQDAMRDAVFCIAPSGCAALSPPSSILHLYSARGHGTVAMDCCRV